MVESFLDGMGPWSINIANLCFLFCSVRLGIGGILTT